MGCMRALFTGCCLAITLLAGVPVSAAPADIAGTWLSVWEDADWAVRFYRKRGFVAFATHTFTVGQTDFTDDLMWRALDAG